MPNDHQSAINRPSNDDYDLMNFKMKPEHRLAFRIKCIQENRRMSDVLRNAVAAFLRDELPC